MKADKILELHDRGIAPSRIDAAMQLEPGTARKAIVDAWRSRTYEASANLQERKLDRRCTPPDTVRKIRARKGKLTAQQCATRLGVDRRTVQRIWNE